MTKTEPNKGALTRTSPYRGRRSPKAGNRFHDNCSKKRTVLKDRIRALETRMLMLEEAITKGIVLKDTPALKSEGQK